MSGLTLFVASFAVLVANPQERPRCAPIPGAEALWTHPGLRFVLVGEMHGTKETPAIFADLVCSARTTKRTVIAALEFRDQHAVDASLGTEPRQARMKALLSTEEWKGSDGRASQAMLALLERLRSLEAEGVLSRVIAFSASGHSGAQDEQAMASALLTKSASDLDALIIVLTGNLHAAKKPLLEAVPYPPMGAFLPPAQTISLLVTDLGGEAWNRQNGTCGPHRLASSGGAHRGITLVSPHAGYDGVLSTGVAATSSKPASR